MENTPAPETPKKGHILIITALIAALVGGGFGFVGGFAASTDVVHGALLASLPSGVRDMLMLKDATKGPSGNDHASQQAQAPQTYEDKIVSAVATASPAVVSIVATKDVPVITRSYFDPFGGNNDFFNQFFGGMMGNGATPAPQGQQNGGTQKQDVSAGSGFFVSDDGYIVTNRHVVEDTQADYTAITQDGTRYPAKVLARDTVNDIAVVKIDTGDAKVPFITFGDSSKVKVGQSVIAIGYALGQFGNSVSLGIISGLSRSITAGDGAGMQEALYNVIQTDAAINPGNSGGPLLSSDGKAIGMNVAVAQGGQNIGFALPIEDVRTVVDSVRQTGRIVRPYLGVRYVMITPDLVKTNQLPVDDGALVVRGQSVNELAVMPGSPADIAGIVENDIITEINGQKLDSDHPLALVVRDLKVGDTITMKVLHKGQEETLTATLTERKQ